MCKPQKKETKGSKTQTAQNNADSNSEGRNSNSNSNNKNNHIHIDTMKRRRGKRVKQSSLPLKRADAEAGGSDSSLHSMYTKTTRVMSSLSKKHSEDTKSGGVDAILPSLGIIVVLGFAIVAKMGWR